ncbi:hypothetical protein [Mucilaginibacter gotjawali]|uniref:Uncharacterized protein n=2 Tax=Mucilaginibacter gotjawali TaxID=1550579 RepID=A0A110B001_9SPHI|nr:hypothetical protein [Mucilaginibacter gotjawali]MBB3059134.1 hypothetical protein [Mucilaginibacter gotjawali]BAU52123.1 hypothetical protein MgSA37_00273 [Mucilaginibacter gotjawali]
MAQIVLEVNDAVGKSYNSLNQKQKEKYNRAISLMLTKVLNDITDADYSRLLDEIGNEAIKNGLTPEILESLLASDD